MPNSQPLMSVRAAVRSAKVLPFPTLATAAPIWQPFIVHDMKREKFFEAFVCLSDFAQHEEVLVIPIGGSPRFVKRDDLELVAPVEDLHLVK